MQTHEFPLEERTIIVIGMDNSSSRHLAASLQQTHFICAVVKHNTSGCKVLRVRWNYVIFCHKVTNLQNSSLVLSRSGSIPQSHARAVHSTCQLRLPHHTRGEITSISSMPLSLLMMSSAIQVSVVQVSKLVP